MMLRKRPRRLRQSESVRRLVSENKLSVDDLIMPFFLQVGVRVREEIKTMPNIYRLSVDEVLRECEQMLNLGLSSVAIFPSIEENLKDPLALESINDNGFYPRSIARIKKEFPEMTLISDVAMDPYNSNGHDGVVTETGEIDNDVTLPILAKMAVTQAQAGADFVAPSDMMDGRVARIRDALDESGFSRVGILSYAVKYASCFYGPFREALGSAPKTGDKRTYQMDPANSREAEKEVLLDIEEGADIIMVKPGLPFLDILSNVKKISTVPVAVYNVSGEYAMLNFAALHGSFNYQDAVGEILLGFKRAGADLIFSYHSIEFARWLSEKR